MQCLTFVKQPTHFTALEDDMCEEREIDRKGGGKSAETLSRKHQGMAAQKSLKVEVVTLG